MRLPARFLTAAISAVGLSVAVAVPALAHPLGNFTINRFSQVQIAGDRAEILYVVDFAEIPAFQEKQRMADQSDYLDGKVRQLAGHLDLQVDGRPVPLQVTDRSLALLPGQAGLQTLRLSIVLEGDRFDASRHVASYRDANFSGRLGWKEIVIQSAGGAKILSSSAPATSATDQLRTYPKDMLASPLDITEASFTFFPGALAPVHRASLLRPIGTFGFIQDRFAALITPQHLSFPLLALSLLAAIALGALHALSPGHGKAVMAGYLVGAQGTARQAVSLGLTITVTHTAGVFALGLITIYLAGLITPERLYPWLTLLSGLLILGLGAVLIWSRGRMAMHGHSRHDRRGHGHSHPSPPAARSIGRRSLLALGISGGLIPCPSALVVLLAAISLHRLAFGLFLIVAFSLGLAITLTGIGLALAGGIPLVKRVVRARPPRLAVTAGRLLPVASALVVTFAGLGLTLQALQAVR